jgi:hypothetical protein
MRRPASPLLLALALFCAAGAALGRGGDAVSALAIGAVRGSARTGVAAAIRALDGGADGGALV